MKAWVTGKAGMLAKQIVKQLEDSGAEVIATSRGELDISNKDAVNAFCEKEQFTHIFNCAAFTSVDSAESMQDKAESANEKGPYYLAQAASDTAAQFIHFSSDYVFSGAADDCYKEDSAPGPVNAYGKTKLAGEQRILEACPQACIIRTSSLFGPGGKNFVETMLNLMRRERTVKVVRDQIMRPTYSGDLAQAALDLKDASGIFHFANSGECSWYDFAVAIQEEAKKRDMDLAVEHIEAIGSHDYPQPALRPQFSVLCTEKVSAFLGRPPRHWKEALSDYFEQMGGD